MSGTKDKRQKRPFPEDTIEGHTQPIDDLRWDAHRDRSEIALGWEQRGASQYYGHLVRTSQTVVVRGEHQEGLSGRGDAKSVSYRGETGSLEMSLWHWHGLCHFWSF